MATKQENKAVTENSTKRMLSLEEELKRKLKFQRKKDTLLNSIGAIGWNEISTPLMVSLFTGLPICLMGEAGTGKTFIAKQVAGFLLSVSIAAIDASKCDWEELVGPYNMEAYMKGEIKYLKTPVSLFGKEFVFADEINRADNKVQNGFLEIMKDNTLNGMSTSIKYKWAAANYLTHEGTQPLTEALADRFVFVLDVPTLLSQSEKNLKQVTEQGADVDDHIISQYVPGWERISSKYKDMSEAFKEYMLGVGQEYAKIKGKLKIPEYVISLAKMYMGGLNHNSRDGKQTNPYLIEQRRVNQLVSAITAYLSVELYEYNQYIESLPEDKKEKAKLLKEEKDTWIHSLILECVLRNVNVALSGKEFNQSAIQTAHQTALKVIDSADLEDVIYRIKSETDLTKRFFLSLLHIEDEPLEIHDAFDRIYSKYDLNEDNQFGVKFNVDSKDLDGFDTFIPLLILTMKDSPFKKYWDKIPVELQTKINEMIEFAYQYKLLENNSDYQQEITDFLGKETFDELNDGKDLRSTYKDSHKSLSLADIVLRETTFRRFVADEGKFAVIALSLGEETKMTDAKKIAAEKKLREDQYNELVFPSYQYNVKKVNEELNKIKDILKIEGKENILI